MGLLIYVNSVGQISGSVSIRSELRCRCTKSVYVLHALRTWEDLPVRQQVDFRPITTKQNAEVRDTHKVGFSDTIFAAVYVEGYEVAVMDLGVTRKGELLSGVRGVGAVRDI